MAIRERPVDIMKGLTCVWFALLCYLVCIKCATIFVTTSPANLLTMSSLDEHTERDWRLFKRRSNFGVQQGFDGIDSTRRQVRADMFEKSNEFGDKRATFFSADKCLRYCITKSSSKNQQDFQYTNLFWTTNDTEDVTDRSPSNDDVESLSKVQWTDTQNANSIRKNCQIYLDLDCNTPDAETASKHVEQKFHSNVEDSNARENDFGSHQFIRPRANNAMKILEKYHSSQQMQTKFFVDTSSDQILINIDGIVSKVLLQIPAGATAWRHGMLISWTRKNNGDGVRIEIQNAPPGEWRLKLIGASDSKYNVTAESFDNEKNKDHNHLFLPFQRVNGDGSELKVPNYSFTIRTKGDRLSAEGNISDGDMINTSTAAATKQSSALSIPNSMLRKNGRMIEERSVVAPSQNEGGRNGTREENINDNDSLMFSPSAENELINLIEYVTVPANDTNAPTSTDNFENETSGNATPTKDEKLSPRSPIVSVEDIDMSIRSPMDIDGNTKLIQTVNNREFSDELVSADNEIVGEKRLVIEVNRNSNLLVTPGTIHRVVFDVKNNCVLPVKYAFRARSTPFRLYNVQPVYAWVYPGQTSSIGVDIIVPDNIASDTVNTVTLSIVGTQIKEKSVHLYVQGSLSKLTDDVRPTITHSFNNNCAGKLEKSTCYKSRWSADITIQDYDSGLKHVVSSPNSILPRTDFISGTRNPVTFYYSSTCCDKTAKITATDLVNNYITYTIDVTAWDNLSQAEIAAITIGAFLALLLIGIIVVLVIYCVRKRSSHDLPYTQRYGSRPPAHSERTNL